MTFYLDANVLVSLFIADAHSSAVADWLGELKAELTVSDFGRLEFAAVVSRQTREGLLNEDTAREIFADCDLWCSETVRLERIRPHDFDAANSIVRDFATKLAAPDAIHLAFAANREMTLVTFDRRLAQAAQGRGTAVVMAG